MSNKTMLGDASGRGAVDGFRVTCPAMQHPYTEAEIDAVVKVMREACGQTQGKYMVEFEQAFCAFTGNRSALLYFFHDLFRNSDLFNDLIDKITIVKFDIEVFRYFSANGISFGSIFTANRYNQLSHIDFLSPEFLVPFFLNHTFIL